MEVQFIFWQWAPSYPCTCFYGASARHGRQQFRKRRPSSVGWGDGGSGPIPFWPNHSGPTPVGPVRSNLWTVLALLIFSRIIWKLRTLNIFSQANKFIVTKKVNKKIWQHIYILSHTLTTSLCFPAFPHFRIFTILLKLQQQKNRLFEDHLFTATSEVWYIITDNSENIYLLSSRTPPPITQLIWTEKENQRKKEIDTVKILNWEISVPFLL